MATVDRLNALQFLRGTVSPRQAWLDIAAKYGGTNAADAARCYEELNALKFTSDARSFLVTFYSLLERLETRLGRPLEDQEGRTLLLRTLPTTLEWNVWAASQRSRDDQDRETSRSIRVSNSCQIVLTSRFVPGLGSHTTRGSSTEYCD